MGSALRSNRLGQHQNGLERGGGRRLCTRVRPLPSTPGGGAV